MIDVFKVGIHLGMTSNAPAMLGVIARHFAGIHASAQQLQHQFGKVALAVGSVAAAMAGLSLVKGVWHTIEAAKELNAELNRTAQLGGNLRIDPASLRRQAFAAANEVRTLNPAEAVKLERELAGQVGSHEKAFAVLPFAARLAWNLEEFTGANSESAIRDAVKVADLRGNIFSRGKDGEEEVDVEKLKLEMDALAKGVKASGGLLKPSDYVQFAKQSGLAGKAMDPTAFYGWATEAMIAMGAPRAGTAMTSLFNQFQAGTAPAHAWRELAKESGGVFKEGRDFKVEKGGHTTITAHGRSALHLDEMKANDLKWVNDTLIPMLSKGGIKDGDMLTELTRVLGRQNVQRLVGEAYQNRVQFARTASLFEHAENVDDSSKMLHDKDLETNMREMQEAWKGLMQALGEPGIPIAIQVMHKLTDAIHYMTDRIAADPEMAEKVLKIAAGFGMLLVAAGALTVIVIAFRAFGGAVSGLFSVFVRAPIAAISGLGSALGNLFGLIGRFLAGAVGSVLIGTAAGGLGAAWAANRLGYGQNLADGIDGVNAAMTPEGRANFMRNLRSPEAREGFMTGLNPATPPTVSTTPSPLMNSIKAWEEREAARKAATPPPPPGQPGGAPVNMTGTVVLDGKAMGTFIGRTTAEGLATPNAGTSHFDAAGTRVDPGNVGH